MELLTLINTFIFGTILGSFLNVVVLRHGFSEKTNSRSECFACRKKLTWYELIPLVSFLVLKGRCSGCGTKISIQYPLVELLTGAVFLFTFLLLYPITSILELCVLIGTLYFWSAFIVLVVYDIKHTLVPPLFSLNLLAGAIAVRVFEFSLFPTKAVFYDALFGALIFGGFLYILYLITRGRGMGLGDAHVGAALGVFFGIVQSFETLIAAFWIGALCGIALLTLKKRFTIKSEVPFVPFLFIAALISAFTVFSPLELITLLISF